MVDAYLEMILLYRVIKAKKEVSCGVQEYYEQNWVLNKSYPPPASSIT